MNYESLLLIYTLLLYGFIFLLGICIGSFLNVLIYRIPNSIPFTFNRSHCPKCNHLLHLIDLFPIFSYIFLKGKCRYCKNNISIRYLMIELLTGVLFLITFYRYGFSLSTLIYLIAISLLIVIALIDYDTMYIYDYNHLFFIVLSFIRFFFINDLHFSSHLIGSICISFPLFIIYHIIKDSIGGGDIKLMFSCGFLLGTPLTILSFLISTITASIYAAYLILFKHKKRNEHIALGPFLCLGFITSILFGNELIYLFFLI